MRRPFRPSSPRRGCSWLQSAFLLASGIHLVTGAPQTGRKASFVPSAIPLTVRSPYLSAWQHGGDSHLYGSWASFSDSKRILGWTGYAAVDGKVYLTMGSPGTGAPNTANQTGFYMTATSSVFTLVTGPVSLTYTFLSPITPDDLVRQSIPFAYISVQAASMDGLQHTVKIYTDISGEWLASDIQQPMQWNTTVNGHIVTHKLQLKSLQTLKEVDDRIYDGAAYYVSSGGGLTYQSGQDTDLRSQFIQNHILLNERDAKFRPISPDWPVFAFCQDLGAVLFNSDPVVFAIGHMRDQVATISTSSGNQNLRSYFRQNYSNIDDVVSFVVGDFEEASRISSDFDAKVDAAAAPFSDPAVDYPALLYLSARQSLGATELTTNGVGRPMLFVKDMYNTRTVNAVDAVYAMWPLLRYMNPRLAMAALEPILAYQSGNSDSSFCVHDLGLYPIATGFNDGTIASIPVAASSSVLIMALDAARASGDVSQLSDYYPLLNRWTTYLVNHALYPDSANQFSLDQMAGSLTNQTNLALQGILGIGAAAAIADLTGHSEDAKKYASVAQSYAAQWETTAVTPNGTALPHILLSYGDGASWCLAYNLYMDRLLGLNLVSRHIYDIQEDYYKQARRTSGIALDSRGSLAITEWTLWAAAVMNDTELKQEFIGGVREYAGSIPADTPTVAFPDVYDAVTGLRTAPDNPIARPHVGGHFAILALEAANTNATPTSPSGQKPSSGRTSRIQYPTFICSVTLLVVSALYLLS
ncbi:DUF1793-domain-containing protein [Auricularia subglabra TFB-10046 SS5]|nr:DUF1793-domain-containing protein [Auricularia subglabra TFB-10046 SS5]